MIKITDFIHEECVVPEQNGTQFITRLHFNIKTFVTDEYLKDSIDGPFKDIKRMNEKQILKYIYGDLLKDIEEVVFKLDREIASNNRISSQYADIIFVKVLEKLRGLLNES